MRSGSHWRQRSAGEADGGELGGVHAEAAVGDGVKHGGADVEVGLGDGHGFGVVER